MIEQNDPSAATTKAPSTERTPSDARSRSGHDGQLSAREQVARYGVLIAPLVLVNAAAIYGQVHWAANHLTGGNHLQAVLFALTLESIAVYLAYEAHAALIAGDASFRLRAASYLAALIVGALNYSHFATDNLAPTTEALAFGGLSTISPWLWSIRSRSMRRDQLRAAGLIDPRSAHFAAAKWIHFPIRSLRAYRWSVDNGVQEERAAWDAYRSAARTTSAERARERGSRRSEHAREQADETARSAEVISEPTPDPVRRGSTTRSPGSNAHTLVSTRHRPVTDDDATQAARGRDRSARPNDRELRDWIMRRTAAGEIVTGAVVGGHYGVSPATGRRWLQALQRKLDPPNRDPASSASLHADNGNNQSTEPGTQTIP